MEKISNNKTVTIIYNTYTIYSLRVPEIGGAEG